MPEPMLDLPEVKRYWLEQIRADADAHEQGDYAAVGENYESLRDFDVYLAFAGDEEADNTTYNEWERLRVAEDFWRMWVDTRNHSWNYYPGIKPGDWPILARQLCDGIEAGLSADELRHNAKVFDLPAPAPFSVRWRRSLNGYGV